ncbi:DNA polymerase IV [Treponema sp.]|uniref:DNA polymerase IV n=1 Tax=Treponema sp. TaxID=166 RepID=UPI00298EA04E|nr:DNA polymerase IV [Treponema sp.]MCR5613341.1 DNA polymerase IV [Treponema sp.]
MSESYTKCFFHVDLDAFFASVEQLVHPEYRGKPVIISGNPHQRRNVVSTASYEARKFGVHSAMPAFRAYELCPQGIFVEPNMKLYSEYSIMVMNILKDFSPDIIQLSIDEACLDMTGTERLFGKPEEVAVKIKNTVKEKTGLTISIGIATNSYLAKICSDIKKPDGLYQIKPGDEESFMSSLPLNKVWGIGEKTLARLNSSGFRTVNDIKNHSLKFLQNIYGQASASFLYNVCRGIEPENFRSKPKSHSLSSETTFEFDLTERQVIETYLLGLSSEVMERLLRENKTSLTVFLKIRYEDFTTVSCQSTYETPVICTDELYTRILSLFNSKYEFGRGVRLLGVGVQNIIGADKLAQGELFEDENKKKQKVEKAILELENKKPEIKVHKARLLKTAKTLFASLFILFSAHQLNAQTEPVRDSTKQTTPTGAATINENKDLPPEKSNNGTNIFSYTEDKTSVEFYADGFWNMRLLQTTNSTFGYGKDFNISFGMPVFEQEVDLSVWFLLNNHWYIKGAFADKFNKNTIALGYTGDDVVKEVKISNRQIVFPETYSLTDIGRSIGGGDNQAPGISASFAKDKWKLDVAARYDMLMSFDKTFYGKNAVNLLKVQPQNYLTGSIFILPDTESTTHVSAVYVEEANGPYTDEAGRHYKKLSENQYLILAARNQIILSEDARAKKVNGILPCVLIEFDTDADSLLTARLGTFGTPDVPGTLFLGKIQKYFGSSFSSSKQIPVIASYSYGKKKDSTSIPDKTGTYIDGFFVTMQNKKMLLAQNSSFFSPFIAAFRYDGGIGNVQDIQVASSSSEIKSTLYSAVQSDTVDIVKTDFFNTKRTYADVFNSEYTLASKDSAGANITYSSPEINFPFADKNPGIYLGLNSENDDCIMFKNYSPVSRLDIGTKAVNGTVTVYKNGIIDSSAKYNPQTGEVTLSSGLSDSDKIYITWFEDSNSAQTGMIAAATGFSYNFTDSLTGDIAASSRWTINPDLTYAQYKRNANGYATLSSKIKWEEEKIMLSNVIGATFQIDNVTGNYRIAGMDNAKPSTAYLNSDAAKNLPINFAPLINLRPNETGIAPELTSQNNCSVSSSTGSMDTGISGYKIPVSYNFSNAQDPSSGEVLWASTTIAQGSNKGVLSNASKYSIAFKLSDKFIALTQDPTVNTKVYLQLGVSADTDFTIENKGNIPTWKIYDSSSAAEYYDIEKPLITESTSSFNPETSWQTVTVTVRDNDRASFAENYNARIIITTDKKPSSALTGTIYAGPYETVSQGIYVKADSVFSVNTEQIAKTNPSTQKFNKEKNYIQTVRWALENMTPSAYTDSKIIIYKYFDEVDISAYKTINLTFSYSVSGAGVTQVSSDDTPFELILDTGASNSGSDGKKALSLKLNSSQIQQYIDYQSSLLPTSTNLHNLEIDRINGKIKIDGKEITGAQLYVNPDVIPSRLKIKTDSIVLTNNSSTTPSGNISCIYPEGLFCIDELYLSDCSPKVILQDQIKTRFSHKGDIVTIKDFPLLKDAELSATGDFIETLYTNDAGQNKFGFSGNANADITFATIKITNELGRSSSSKNVLTKIGHSISTTQKVFNFLSFDESFIQNTDDKTTEKQNSFALDFSKFKFPLVLKGAVKMSTDSWSSTQTINDSLNFSIGNKFKYDFSANVNASQKNSTTNNTYIATLPYFESYAESTKYQFSFGESNATKRTSGANITNTFVFPFANFSPKIIFSENGTYTSTTQNIFSDTTSFETVFPFKIKNQNFSFSYSKTSSLIQNIQKGGDYGRDITTMAQSMSCRPWFFYAMPVYDLISSDLASKVLNTMPDARPQSSYAENYTAQSVNYNGSYNFTWKRPIYASMYDLFVPTIASLSFARDISTAENIADNYQLKANLSYTAVNMFSKDGSFPLLKWCESDEYTASFQATLKIPRSDSTDVKQIYTTYIQANFYKTQEDVLRTAVQFSFQDAENWNGKATLLYKRKSHFTPILEIVKLFKSEFDYSNVSISRSNALNFTCYSSRAASTNAKLRQYQSIELSHLIEFEIIKQISINAGISGIFTHTRDEICSLEVTLTLGGKLKF